MHALINEDIFEQNLRKIGHLSWHFMLILANKSMFKDVVVKLVDLEEFDNPQVFYSGHVY